MVLVIAVSPIVAQMTVEMTANASWCEYNLSGSFHGKWLAWKDVSFAYVTCSICAWIFTCIEFAVAKAHDHVVLQQQHQVELQAKDVMYTQIEDITQILAIRAS
ncbi:hypothetical protein ACHHYP_20196 [Achlya hypogyna]|uniref:Uncharacterized protein n=1 Tax=Achlya hypogyna TaxID=1202772 RepID=A0A1V9YZB6_ACHHY|nr:hypothetical protein ACHHYP_20196 [Achlya hypogyna]